MFVFGAWSRKCVECTNYAGSLDSAGFCRVSGTLIPSGSAVPRGCPHWSSRDLAAGRVLTSPLPG